MDKIPQEPMNVGGTIRQFLVMCAACKKMRGDNGLWRHIKGYPASHENREISHGICPDCARALYPEYCR